ncbi:MAG TPA: hypothetical protein VMH87_03495 [Pseudomonadales bacterium]|nr:hypothetical protein [Pseudomonadales bacterium]
MTFGEFLSHQDAGDVLIFAFYYLPSLIVAFFAILIPTAFFAIRKSLNWNYVFILTVSAICCWGIYSISMASQYMTLALLGSESSEAAEFAYQKSFKPNLHQAINLAVSSPGWEVEETSGQNVRFYAACRIADILASSNPDFQNTTLEKVQNASIVTAGFFGTNSINGNFFVPNRTQPELSVADIIRIRLMELENSRANRTVVVRAH